MIVNWRQNRQLVSASKLVIVLAVTRRDVDRAGAGLHRDKVGGEHDCVAVEKRMSRFDLVDLCTRKRLEWFAGRLEFCVCAKLRNQFVGEQQSFGNSVLRKFLDDIKFFW